MPGEFDFLAWIRRQQKAWPHVRIGSGDDLAAIDWPAADLLLVGVDQVLDGVHFDSAIHSPKQIGRKAMNRNLSDCGAMGCLPAAAVATVALPRDYPLAKAQELYFGLAEAGEAFGCPIIGGDTGSWDGKLVVTVTILGRAAGVQPIQRSGAKVGDGIYVTGALGGSILGRHLTFEPRVNLGRSLASGAHPIHAMIDLSDGLSRDLAHICRESGVGALLNAEKIPVHADAIELGRRDSVSPLEHALHDGEDYDLLFTGPIADYPATRIGTIVAGSGVSIQQAGQSSTPLEPRAWQHQLG